MYLSVGIKCHVSGILTHGIKASLELAKFRDLRSKAASIVGA